MILRVADLGRAVEFYRDLLGLQVSSVGPAFAFFDLGAVHLALNRVDGGDPAAAASTTELTLEVDDPVRVHRKWTDAGVEFSVDLRPVMEQDGRRLMAAHFRDPDGHLVSLTGWVEAGSDRPRSVVPAWDTATVCSIDGVGEDSPGRAPDRRSRSVDGEAVVGWLPGVAPGDQPARSRAHPAEGSYSQSTAMASAWQI